MRLSALELCAGGGGQALGLEAAQFECIGAVEIDPYCCATLHMNRPSWKIIQGDLREFKGSPYRGIDLVAAGVPCPPFSIAGKQLGGADERDMFPSALRIIKEAAPRAVLLENVPGFASSKFIDYRHNLLTKLNRLGYKADWRVIQAADYGVPQLRPRFVLVALRPDDWEYFLWPEPVSKTRTVGPAIKDLMEANGWLGIDNWVHKADRIAPTVVGGSKKHGGPDLGPTRAKRQWRDIGIDGMGLADNAPGADFDPEGLPRLTVRMVARIQSFPDDWQFSGRKTAAYRQVGNAFPPLVAKAVGDSIEMALRRQSQAFMSPRQTTAGIQLFEHQPEWQKLMRSKSHSSSNVAEGKKKMKPLIQTERRKLHQALLQDVLTIGPSNVPSIADKGNSASIQIAAGILNQIGTAARGEKIAGQTAGNLFEAICASYLESTFLSLHHLRPGEWRIMRLSQGDRIGITRYEQYAHLSAIAEACKEKPELSAMLGTDYIICPDIVIIRQPVPDEVINHPRQIVSDKISLLTSLRLKNQGLPLIHASISCKLTLRSDRAQNARSEALNLIRNRKGRAPHIAVVTAEPLPSRLASLALGTGDIDCVYHFALPELQQAVAQIGHDDSKEMLKIMIEGKRLRDISDLPLDLAI
jgi:DNA (cytosine-5)-methyltransferase 1